MKNILILIFGVFLLSGVFAFDVSQYDYKLSLTPECSEYMGFVRFEFPAQFNEIRDAAIYSEDDIVVDFGKSRVMLKRNSDWFVNSFFNYDVREIESVFDGNFQSDLVISDSGAKMVFQNPMSVPVDKVVIETKDSLIDGFEVYAAAENIDFSVVNNKFHYELNLDNFVGDKIEIEFNFDGVLKVREVSFFDEIENDGVYGYFYVDNDCNRTRDVYFGEFGESRFSKGAKSLPVFFSVDKKLMVNSLYDDDFDDDGHLNEVDNCLDVSNVDQKDIDYNGRGDACDDFDSDGVMNVEDNCPRDSNRNQADDDGDGLGNVCDEEDSRFFESNALGLILLVVVIIGAFGFLTFKILKS